MRDRRAYNGMTLVLVLPVRAKYLFECAPLPLDGASTQRLICTAARPS